QPLPEWRLAFDGEVMRLLEPYSFDVGLLAGYMLIFGPEPCQQWTLLNLHPALPGGPIGPWQEVVWQLIDSRAEESGVLLHLAVPELDSGPPLTYCRFS